MVLLILIIARITQYLYPNLKAAWVDYDNDNDLDLFAYNSYISQLYRNDGGDIFTEDTSLTMPD